MAEPLLVAVASPMLLFPRGFLPWVGLCLIGLGWIGRSLATRKWLPRTPLDRPILVILLMTIVSLYPSTDLALSLPKFYGILLSAAIYYATVRSVSYQRGYLFGIGLLLVSLVGVSLVGLVGTEWNIGKYPILDHAYRLSPRLLTGIQTSFGTSAGIHPNELGGTLAFLLPLPMALLVCRGVPDRVPAILWRVVLVAVILVGLSVLALTVSRSALVGVAAASVILLVWRWRRLGLSFLFATVLALGIASSRNTSQLSEFALKVDSLSTSPGAETLSSRMEVWSRAIYMIQDFPFTGIGLNTFPTVLNTLYPSLLAGPDVQINHAHNIYLQAAVDLGLGGLLGFLGLWACLGHTGWRAYCSARSLLAGKLSQPTLVGLLLGLVSYLIYGLTDAISFGAKPTVLLWLMMGLIVSGEGLANQQVCYQQSVTAQQSLSTRTMRLALMILGDAFWIVTFFLVAMGYMVVGLGISRWTP